MAGLISPPKTVDYVNQVSLPDQFKPAADPAAPAPNVARNITANETAAGQVNNIVAADSPLMQSTRGAANVASNSRGLLNSSIGIGAAQKAVIDSAAPLAQQDAQTFANAGQSAQQANEQLKLTGYQGQQTRATSAQDANQNVGTMGYQANLNSAQGKENFGYTFAANEQNIQGNQALQQQKLQADLKLAEQGNVAAMERLQTQGSLDAAKLEKQLNAEAALQTQLKQMGIDLDIKQLDAQNRQSFGTASGSIFQQAAAEISNIERTPDSQMDAQSKAAAIANIRAETQSRVNSLATVYGKQIVWDDVQSRADGMIASAAPPETAPVSQTPFGPSYNPNDKYVQQWESRGGE